MASVTGSSTAVVSLSCSLRQNLALSRVSKLNSLSFSVKGKSFPSIRLHPAAPRFHVACAAKKETVDKVCEIVRKQLVLPTDTTVSGESVISALGADSLDTVEIVMGIEEEFGISVEEESAHKISTVLDAAELIDKLVENKAA